MGKIFFTFYKNYKFISIRSERILSMVNIYIYNYIKIDYN